MDKVKKGSEEQAVMRIGAYGIRLIPGNIVVGKYSLIQSGPNKGIEQMSANTQSFHINYYRAVCNLYDRLLAEETYNSNTVVVKGLIDAEEKTYKMIKDMLKEIKVLPARVTI